jgi:hypothetical protein
MRLADDNPLRSHPKFIIGCRVTRISVAGKAVSLDAFEYTGGFFGENGRVEDMCCDAWLARPDRESAIRAVYDVAVWQRVFPNQDELIEATCRVKVDIPAHAESDKWEVKVTRVVNIHSEII